MIVAFVGPLGLEFKVDGLGVLQDGWLRHLYPKDHEHVMNAT